MKSPKGCSIDKREISKATGSWKLRSQGVVCKMASQRAKMSLAKPEEGAEYEQH